MYRNFLYFRCLCPLPDVYITPNIHIKRIVPVINSIKNLATKRICELEYKTVIKFS